MSAPSTPILDTFPGSDATPPNANWAAYPAVGLSLQQISNTVGSTGGDRAMYWTPTVFGPDMEGFFDVVVAPGTEGIDIYLRVQNPTSTTTNAAYDCNYNGNTGQVQPSWNHGATWTPIGSPVAGALSAGDSLGATIVGNLISMYRRVQGNPWELLGTWTDGNVVGPGTLAFECTGVTSRLDNIGGGTTQAFVPHRMPLV